VLTPRALGLSILCTTLLSQTAAGQGDNAEPIRGGTLRISLSGDWAHWTDRFGRPNPVNPSLREGQREPLGAYFASDSVGTSRVPTLAPAELELRSITGLGAYALNLGSATLRFDASVRSTPLRIDYVPSRRFGVSVAVPLVRSRVSVSLRGPDTSNVASLGNVGLNPALASPTAYAAFRSEVDAALTALATQATTAPTAQLRADAQALYDEYQAALCGMYALAGGSAPDPSSPCFRPTAFDLSPVLPVDTSEAGDSLIALLGRSQTEYEALRAQYQAAGIGIPSFTAGYQLPSSPLDSLGFRQVFSSTGGQVTSDSLAEVVRTGIGDMEVGAWFQLSESRTWRSQLQFLVRLPTGKMDEPGNLVDIGTGDRQMDIEITSRNDFWLGRRLRLFVGARYGIQMADEIERRVTPWYTPIVPATNTALVRRNLGDYLGLDIAPHWLLDEAFEVGFGYSYFRQGATTFEYVNSADQAAIGLPASVLGEATEISRMRAGVGVTFSTLSRYYAGRSRLPLRVTWSYQSTLYGRGGQVPVAGVVRLNIETFIRL